LQQKKQFALFSAKYKSTSNFHKNQAAGELFPGIEIEQQQKNHRYIIENWFPQAVLLLLTPPPFLCGKNNKWKNGNWCAYFYPRPASLSKWKGSYIKIVK